MGVALLKPFIPAGETAFMIAAAAVMTLAASLYRWTPRRAERGHRTPLPLAIKLPAIAMVVMGLALIKQSMGGFMTVAPMVGLISA